MRAPLRARPVAGRACSRQVRQQLERCVVSDDRSDYCAPELWLPLRTASYHHSRAQQRAIDVRGALRLVLDKKVPVPVQVPVRGCAVMQAVRVCRQRRSARVSLTTLRAGTASGVPRGLHTRVASSLASSRGRAVQLGVSGSLDQLLVGRRCVWWCSASDQCGHYKERTLELQLHAAPRRAVRCTLGRACPLAACAVHLAQCNKMP